MKKIALVTGGGRGLGAAICKELADAGYHVIGADLRFAKEGPYKALKVDLASEPEIAKAIGGLDRLDVLVNNAGVDFTLPIEELSVNQWDAVMGVNLRAPFLLSQQAAKIMKRQGGGHIINITSIAGRARSRALPPA